MSTQRRKRLTAAPKKRKRVQIADDQIHYANIEMLKRFLSERGKIRSRRITGLSRRQQALAAREVKRARELALLPYVIERTGTSARGERGERGERGDRDRDRDR